MDPPVAEEPPFPTILLLIVLDEHATTVESRAITHGRAVRMMKWNLPVTTGVSDVTDDFKLKSLRLIVLRATHRLSIRSLRQGRTLHASLRAITLIADSRRHASAFRFAA